LEELGQVMNKRYISFSEKIRLKILIREKWLIRKDKSCLETKQLITKV